MTRKEAIKELTKRYEEQCDKFIRTREIPLALYLKRNVPTLLRNRNARSL
jgi:hypothetical protein